MSNGQVTVGRYFVFTWNNPNVEPDELWRLARDAFGSYLVLQRELSASGTEHFQGYLEFNKNRGIRQLKELLSQAHWQNRKGTQAQAILYCKKHCSACYADPTTDAHSEDSRLDGPWEFGEPVALNNTGVSAGFAPAVKSGKRLRDLYDSYPNDMRKYPRYAEALRALFPPPARDSAPEVWLLYGPPGTGKTRSVRGLFEADELYIKPCDRDFWMNGYDQHPNVLLDDFMGASNHISLTNLLQLLDRYQIRVSTKNGHTWWQPERIYITTNIHPANWYDYHNRLVHYDALIRRFSFVQHFTGQAPNEFIHYAPSTDAWDAFWDYCSHVEGKTPEDD